MTAMNVTSMIRFDFVTSTSIGFVISSDFDVPGSILVCLSIGYCGPEPNETYLIGESDVTSVFRWNLVNLSMSFVCSNVTIVASDCYVDLSSSFGRDCRALSGDVLTSDVCICITFSCRSIF